MKRKIKWVFSLGIILFFLWGILYGILAFIDKKYPLDLSVYKDNSIVVTDAKGQWLRTYLTGDEKWRFANQSAQLPPLYLKLLINFEDRRFYRHSGIDWRAIVRAFGQNLMAGHIVSGASTLTMQTARLLMPHPHNLQGKIVEAFRAWQLERYFSKQAILDIYTTLAPMGKNLEGIKAASYYYFNKPIDKLSLAETAWLVALPQSPHEYNPQSDAKKAHQARDKVLTRAKEAQIISKEDYVLAIKQPLHIVNQAFPFIASQYSDKMRRQQPPILGVIKTSLDKNLQLALEQRLKEYLPLRYKRSNLAAAIMDNHTGQYLAYVGSADFFSQARSGQVDILEAVRSPGSTLKPFITLYAFDWLKYQPDTWVLDTPIVGRSYQPKNYDSQYLGRITLAQALLWSRNVPAVRLLEKIKPDVFAAKLRSQGLRLRFPHNDQANLSLALGGVGIKAHELLSLYRQLAQCSYSLKSALPALAQQHKCWQVTGILQKSGDNQGSLFFGAEPVAFKTGTSYGWRDQWLFAYTKDYSLVLWGGQADGSYALQRASAQDLIPLLRQILPLLPHPPTQYDPPQFDLEINTDNLPQRLANLTAQKAQKFHLITPIDETEIELAQPMPLVIKIESGTAPYIWMVNGKMIAQNAQHQISYPITSSGFYEFSVIDGEGESVKAQVTIRLLP